MADSSELRDSWSTALSVAVANKSVHSLRNTIQRFKRHNRTLNTLHAEVESLISMFDMLKEYAAVESSSLDLLQGPIERCSQICQEFESAMKQFYADSKVDLLDWGKMEFFKGGISDFTETLAGYKSTILVTLGAINIQKSHISEQGIEDYRELIQDTMNDLQIRVQRIDETIGSLEGETKTSSTMVALGNEKLISEQCIGICGKAKSHVESLVYQDSRSQESQCPEKPPGREREGSGDNNDKAIEIISHLQERLASFLSNEGPDKDRERLRLQKDVEISKQCLEVCKLAADAIPNPKVVKVLEVVAEAESDQVIVSTFADRFDIVKAFSRGHSTQLIGSMSSESLQQLSKCRYGSKFGTVPFSTSASPQPAETDIVDKHAHNSDEHNGALNLQASRRKPAPNEMRRRKTEGDR